MSVAGDTRNASHLRQLQALMRPPAPIADRHH